MSFKDKIFREYDIRGTVGTDFDADLAKLLGFAYAQTVCDGVYKDYPHQGGEVPVFTQGGKRPTVAVGRDCRVSGPELTAALVEGLRIGGVNVVQTGMGPTPQLYYAAFSRKRAGGIQVTGSHNPADQNGFKMMIGARTLSGKDIVEMRERVQKFADASKTASLESLNRYGAGEVTDEPMQKPYLQELIERSKGAMGKAKKLKVVVDGGNGVGGMIGPELLRQLGCEVVEIFTEPDGRFPNHHPDPTVLENIVELRKRVIAEKADAGIAWDGDADRIGVVDERAEPIFGDMLLVLYGRQLLKEVEKPIVVADVKCSEILFSDLKKRGAEPVMSKTGHSLIKAKMKELHAQLAGEMSGHMFFAHRYYGFDDALHASARLVEIMSATTQTLSQLLGDLPKSYSTPEIRLDCPDEKKFIVTQKAQSAFSEFPTNTLDGVRITFPHGWGLVRASNTGPVLVMRFEAETPELLKEYQTLVESRIAKLTAES